MKKMKSLNQYISQVKDLYSLNEYISQVKDLHSLNEYISEQLSDVKTHWHPKKDLFTSNDPQEIVDYLMKNSKDQAQAMQRLCFYMNRAGDNMSNKTVLNKAKQLLKKEKVDEKLVIFPSQVDEKLVIFPSQVDEKLVIFPSQVDEKLVINKDYKYIKDNKCLLIYIILWDKNNNSNYYSNNADQVILTVDTDCKVDDDKITLNASSKEDTQKKILKRIDNYYFWKTGNGTLSVYIVGLKYYESLKFLNEISNNIPEKINIHDYFSAVPSNECVFRFYDNKTKTFRLYTKKDIDKLIKKLSK